MRETGHHHRDAVIRSHALHLVAIGGHDDRRGHVQLRDAPPDADDERQTGEEAEGFTGETRGAQSGWDNSEHSLAWRSRGVGWAAWGALATAKITF